MTVNIYDNANEMANVLTETDQYVTWQNAFSAVQGDDEAKTLFQQFQKIQMTVQQLMQSQQTPDANQQQEWDDVAQKVQSNELIKGLMDAEEKLNALLAELNEIVTKPISQAYLGAQQ